MEYRINYTLVGLFVVFLTIFGIGFAYWLGNAEHRKDYQTYLVNMIEPVFGLSVDAPVKFNGVDIGYVAKIYLNHTNLQEVNLLLKIEKDVPITEGTVASLKMQGITGVTYLGLTVDKPDLPLLKKKPGEPYPIIRSGHSFLVQLSDTITEAGKNLTALSESIKKVLTDDNIKTFRETLNHLEVFTNTLAKNSNRFTNITKSTDTFLNGMNQQALPDTVQLLQHLNTVSTNLQSITRDLKQDPSIVIRGKRTHSLGPGE